MNSKICIIFLQSIELRKFSRIFQMEIKCWKILFDKFKILSAKVNVLK